MGQFKILNHQIDSTSPMFIIAEVAQAHDGSLGLAHAFIDAAAKANANAIKFQTHIADAESTPQEPWRVKFSPQDETRYEYWQRMEFTPEQWAGLHQHAADTGLVFLSSAFSAAAVDLLERLDISAWKVASGEINNHPLLDHMMTTQKPILLSSGMSSFAELDRAVNRCKQAGVAVGVFQCTSMYPTPPEKIGLNVIEEMRSRYGIPVGLSDHSARGAAGVAAAVVGADMLEVHVTFHEDMFGPDVPASLT
ncbi:MAG: N-acetylneuraminate synthase family protein, partial [Chloroflexota bacterium]